MEKVSEILLGAMNRIQAKGWCQNTYLNTDGEACLAGSLSRWRSDEEYSSTTPAWDLIEQLIPGDKNLLYWNDTEGRTKEEVLDLLETALSVSMSEEALEASEV